MNEYLQSGLSKFTKIVSHLKADDVTEGLLVLIIKPCNTNSGEK